MVIVEFMGGLGNQMFQYAMGRSLSKHLNTTLKFDLNHLLDRTPKKDFVFRDYDLDVFNLSIERASQDELDRFFKQSGNKWMRLFRNLIIQKINPYVVFREPHFHYTPVVYDLPPNSYLAGYWQSPKYFENVKEEIRKDFTFKNGLLPESSDLAAKIAAVNSVCINVRRADFVTNTFHGACDMKYFMPAIEVMASKVETPHFFLFSDDMKWCEENFKIDKYPLTFVGHEHKGFKFSNYLHLLSLCKHFIIPNSSFAWWSVWLNGNKDKVVIAPKTWLTDPNWDPKDLVSPDWIRIDNG